MDRNIRRFLFLIPIFLLLINGSREYLGYHLVNALLIGVLGLLFTFVVWAIFYTRKNK